MAERKLNDFEFHLCFGSRLMKSLFPFHYKVVVFSLESWTLEIPYTAGRGAARNPQIGHRLEAAPLPVSGCVTLSLNSLPCKMGIIEATMPRSCRAAGRPRK